MYFIFIGLVAKIEKRMTDHTEFINYKNEMDKWLANANETLDECAGIGDENETRQKLLAITVVKLHRYHNYVQKLSLYILHSFAIYRIYQAAYPKANNY